MVAPGSVPLKERHAPELGTPHHEGILEQAPALHVADEGGRGLVHDLGLHGMGLCYVAVRVPVGDSVSTRGIAPVEKLNHPDTLLDQATGQDAVLGVLALEIGSAFGPVFLVNGGGLGGNVHNLGYRCLHFPRQLIACYAGRQVGILRVFFHVTAIEALEQAHGRLVVLGGIGGGAGQVGWRILGAEVGPLKSGRKEAVPEVVLTGTGGASGIVDGNEGGEFVVLRTEGVGGPRTEGGETLHGEARVHEILTLRMGAGLGMEGVHEAEIIG